MRVFVDQRRLEESSELAALQNIKVEIWNSPVSPKTRDFQFVYLQLELL